MEIPAGTGAGAQDETARFVHDLRNHLAVVRAAANLLDRSVDQHDVVRECAAGVRQQVQEIGALIDTFVGKHSIAEPVTETAAQPTATHARGVLIADDNADSARTLAMCLRIEGHTVCVAHDGEDALDMAETHHPDIALIDLSMPGKDGYQVARELRSRPWATHTRLIAVSGWIGPEERARAHDAGFDAHITKPIDVDVLNRLIHA
jgi:CheY-like chemotaxis protein